MALTETSLVLIYPPRLCRRFASSCVVWVVSWMWNLEIPSYRALSYSKHDPFPPRSSLHVPNGAVAVTAN